MAASRDWTRRIFLKMVGAGVPTLSLLLRGRSTDTSQGASSERAPASEKFTPIDLTSHFNASSSQFGSRQKARDFTGDSSRDGLIRIPGGQQTFLGIPFHLGPEGPTQKSWLVLSVQKSEFSTNVVEIPLRKKASFICLAAFCDWDKDDDPSLNATPDAVEGLGERLADAALIYEDGHEQAWPIRRRFEVNSPSTMWGHLSFASLPHVSDSPRKLTEALRDATDWGDVQTVVNTGSYGSTALLWISSLGNPYPEQDLKAVRLRAAMDTPLIICGLTLFHGRENPLRHERLTLYRITLPEAAAAENDRWRVDVDLGVVARTYTLSDFDPDSWLRSPTAGLGSRDKPTQGGRYLYAEVTASSEGTLWLRDTKSRKDYTFDLREAVPGKELEPRSSVSSGARIEILEPDKVWLHGRVVEGTTGSATPVRLAFRSKEGRYIPPYGHRTEINDAWFQDYGADVKLMDSSFAYVDGTFQVELPVGDVYLEMTKGFEHEAVRRQLTIEPGQRELTNSQAV